MKKFLSIVAVLALVLALAAPAFAADDPAVKSVIAPVGSNATITPLPGVTSGMAAADQTEEVFELKVDDGTYTGPSVIAFTYSKAGDVVGVYVQNAEGKWDECKFTANGDEIVVDFPHESPVSFVLKAQTTVEPGKEDTKKPEAAKPGAAAPAAPKSPKTGYNTALWAISAAAMAMAAGVCFSRRKVAE